MMEHPGGWQAQPGASPGYAETVLDGPGIRQRLYLARLPVMPQVLSRLLDACQADAGGEDLAAIVGLDPGIAARVITLASSSLGDERGPLCNLADCAALLGPGVVGSIAAEACAARVFGPLSDGQEAALTRHWLHALKSALLARSLAAAMDYPDAGEAYLAGLMHDVGSLALTVIDPQGYPPMLLAGWDDEHQCRLEQERYQATHADVGAWIAEPWQLGPFLADSMLYHHAPAERLATAHPLIRIVALAHYLAQTDRSLDLSGAIEFARLCGAPADCVAPCLERAAAELQTLAQGLGVQPPAIGTAPQGGTPSPAGSTPRTGVLEARLETELQLDAARRLLEGAADFDALLPAIAQAAMILFGLRPAVFFLREGDGAAFVGKALHARHAKVNQLSFFAGQSASALATATLGTPVVWSASDTWRQPLDAQVVRLLGAEAMVCIPLGAGPRCKALVVAAIQAQRDAPALQARTSQLRAFGRLAELALERARAPQWPVHADGPAKAGASPEQVRHLLHEISTPLSIVHNYLATLKISLGQNAIGDKELQIVTEEIDRVMQILDQFQQAPGGALPGAGPMELRDLLNGILDLCRGSGLAPAAVGIETDFQASALVANPDKLKQVLLNLIKNAFEAMPAGGTLRLSTSRWTGGGAGSQVEILLEDSGPGLPEEVLRNIYQPVTSTKGGKHFGIGLSIAAQLVREMNGFISCRSEPGGCRFRIILPVDTP